MESGVNEVSRVRLPAVLEVQAGINHPRYASLKGIMAAQEEGDRRRSRRPTSGSTPRRWGRRARGWRSSPSASRSRARGAQMLRGRRQGRGGEAGREAAEGSEGALMATRCLGGRCNIAKGSSPRISWESGGRGAEAGGGARRQGRGRAARLRRRRSRRPRWPKLDLAAVHVADHDALRVYTPGAYVGALAPAIREQRRRPSCVFPHTYQSVDYMAAPGADGRRRPAAGGRPASEPPTAGWSGRGR